MKKDKTLNQKQIHILEVAEKMLSRKDSSNFSLRELCQEAQVNLAMISYYFGSKEKMIYSLFEYRIQKTKEKFINFSQTISMASAAMQIKEITNFLIGRMMQIHFFHGLLSTGVLVTKDSKELLEEFFSCCSKTIDTIIKKGVRSGEFGKIVQAEELLASIMGTIIFSIKNKTIFKKSKEEMQDESFFLKNLEQRLILHINTINYSLLEYEK